MGFFDKKYIDYLRITIFFVILYVSSCAALFAPSCPKRGEVDAVTRQDDCLCIPIPHHGRHVAHTILRIKHIIMKHINHFFVTLITLCFFQLLSAQTWGEWKTWGDTHDGYYCNPIMPADFSDIDCICVDGVYYMISSTFQYQPGMIIMRSTDMVNWQVGGYAVKDIRQIGDAMNYDQMDRYGLGIWAGAIRYHKGRFYVYFGTPNEGYFMTSAKKVEGPWDDLTKLSITDNGGWDDCCPFFDEDGKAYLVGTHYADGYKTYIWQMTADYKDVIPSTKTLLLEGAGREASKLYKVGSWYYHLFSEVVHDGRRLAIARAKNIMGPYEKARPMSLTQPQFNEPNQGGFLQDAQGNWFFLTHHGHGDWSGRIASLLPVTWKDEWPIIGQPNSDNIGAMVWRHQKPATRTDIDTSKWRMPPLRDWEWNYYPRTEMAKAAFVGDRLNVTLHAFKPLESDNLMKAGNTLSHRSWSTELQSVIVKMNVANMADGQKSGLCHYSAAWSMFGVMQKHGEKVLFCQANDKKERSIVPVKGDVLYLKSEWGLNGKSRYSYSWDGVSFVHVPEADYQLQWGHYRGDRYGLFCFNNQEEKGSVEMEVLDQQSIARINPFGYSILPDLTADASIQKMGDTYYCYATIDGYDRHLDTSGPPTVWTSKDFVNWSFKGTYFPSAQKELYWAPSKVVPYKGKYYIYPTINGHIYPAVADSPVGPFKLAKGEDRFERPYTNSTLFEGENRYGIDAEIFIDDDGERYAFWGKRRVAKLSEDMTRLVTEPVELPSPHNVYSEGPIFFKRNGIYYYLYTLGGDERYQYAYMYSKVSPMGPYTIPEVDIITTTDIETGVYGPGHGCVFNDEGTDNWYFAFLDFGRRSTNRQTYVNKIEFNADGTIAPVEVTLQGVGQLGDAQAQEFLKPSLIKASSERKPLWIVPNQDNRLSRTEYFGAAFACDNSNSSRWMASDEDQDPWLMMDLGKKQTLKESRLCFVRPTEDHSYILEASNDGKHWSTIVERADDVVQSPYTDTINAKYRYLRVRITKGVKGIWEWKVK